MEEKRIPAKLLNTLFRQVDEVMGRRSLILLLRHAGLGQYVDRLPPSNHTPTITVAEYSHLLAGVYDVFGPNAARSILMRPGHVNAAEIWRQRGTQRTLPAAALKFLPAATRMRLVLERLVEQGQELYGTPHHLHEDDLAFELEIEDCPFCAEIARQQRAKGEVPARPVCHIPASIVDEMIEWATGQKHLVEETACIALGDPTCRFRIAR